MKFLLLYKGDYGSSLRGPEMRYASLAVELLSLGHQVILCGRTGNKHGIPAGAEFVPVSRGYDLLRAFFSANVVVLHGGGPLILLFAMLVGFWGKRLVLDSYVPHWIELDEVVGKSSKKDIPKLLIKAYFNVARSLLGGLVFDKVIVANKRQLDLFRGITAPFLLTHDFSRISVIPFGCERHGGHDKANGRLLLARLSEGRICEEDFLIGWLGGTYGWFDLESVLSAISKAILKNKNIKLVFFGADGRRQSELLSFVDEAVKGNIIFLPWVEFGQRFEYWAGFDISLVWGGEGYENDYASRTRNFDCLTLGLPVVQNEDDEWGERLEKSGAGVVTNLSSLPEVVYELSGAPGRIAEMHHSMLNLASDFYWSRFATALEAISVDSMSRGRRLIGIVGCLLLFPALLFFLVCSVFIMIFRGK